VQFFSSNSYGCLLSTHAIFLQLKSGSKVKISKNSELSRLPKIKKISLSMVRIFHISAKSFSLFFFAWKDSAWSHLQLYPVWISKILTFYIAFREVCMGWFLFQMGLFLVKCRLRVKTLPDF
jgi:hypothetical protein